MLKTPPRKAARIAQRWHGLACGLVLAIAPAFAAAYVPPASLKEITQRSNFIVIGRVTKISKIDGMKIATLQVTETLKGAPRERRQLQFLAEGTWFCDTSTAMLGETGLFFLSLPDVGQRNPKGARGVLRISWAGRGRLPIQIREGEEFATLGSGQFHLLEGVSSTSVVEPEKDSHSLYVPMKDLMEAIRRILDDPSPA